MDNDQKDSFNNSDCSTSRNWKNPKSHKCVICEDYQNDFPGRRYYTFPKDPVRSDKWAAATGCKWILDISPAQRKRLTVCEKHFERNHFNNDTKKRLTAKAVPISNSPSPSPSIISINSFRAALTSKLNNQLAPANNEVTSKSSDIGIEGNISDVSGIIFSPSAEASNPKIDDVSEIFCSTPAESSHPKVDDVSGIFCSTHAEASHSKVDDISGIFCSTPAESRFSKICGLSSTPVSNKRFKRRVLTPKTRKIKRLSAQLYYQQKKYHRYTDRPVSVTQILNSMKGLVTPAVHGFIASQLKNTRVSKYGRRWSVKDKSFALQLYLNCPKAYNSLKHIFILPSKSTVLKCLSGMKLSPGFSKPILESFKFLASKLSSHDKKCIVSFDEMKLKSGLSFDVKHDQIIGFENYGSFSVKKPRLATHALVFMVRGLCKKWKQVFGYFFSCESASSAVLKHLLNEGLSKLVKCGLEPVAVVCDQGANNQRLYAKELGVTEEQPFFFVHGRKIYTLFDTPHLLKSVRNNFLRYPVKFSQKGLQKVAMWKHIYEAWEFDSEMTHRFAPKLTESHVDVDLLNKMNVRLAAQVFSHSVAAILCYLSATNKIPEAHSTADFCGTMNDLFDSVNGRMIKHDKPLLGAVSKNSPHLDAWKNFIDFFKSVEFQTQEKHGKRKIRFPCLQGWLITLSAFRQMIPELLITIPYILMSRFTQDALENFFFLLLGVRVATMIILRQLILNQELDY